MHDVYIITVFNVRHDVVWTAWLDNAATSRLVRRLWKWIFPQGFNVSNGRTKGGYFTVCPMRDGDGNFAGNDWVRYWYL